VLPLLALLLAGCRDTQNSLAPESHQSKDIASLFWWMMGGAWIGLGVVVALLFLAWKRASRRGLGTDTEGPKPGERAGWIVVVGAGIVAPIVVLVTIFVVSNLFVIKTTEAPAANTTTWMWVESTALVSTRVSGATAIRLRPPRSRRSRRSWPPCLQLRQRRSVE